MESVHAMDGEILLWKVNGKAHSRALMNLLDVLVRLGIDSAKLNGQVVNGELRVFHSGH